MNKNLYSKLLTGYFCLFLSGVMCLNLASADNERSELENRSLAQEPELSLEVLLDGSYMTDYENYLYDQFFGRDHWVALKSTMERLIGKQENNGVFFGSKDTLLNQIETPSAELMEKNAGYINSLAENVSVPVAMGLIPSSASVWADRLPNNAPTADEVAEIAQFNSWLSDKVAVIPFVETLGAHSNEDVFYRTDHHWTSLGAYYGYTAIANTMGVTPVNISDYTPTVASDAFFGTTFSTSGVRWVKPDTIHTYVPNDGSVKVTSNFTGVEEEGTLYAPSFLEVKDKYSYFLGGNQAICVMETDNYDAPSVLVIRDSYADSMAPFLTESFSKIIYLDPRYYNAPISAFIESQGVDQVIVMYSLYNFVQENNLFKLGI